MGQVHGPDGPSGARAGTGLWLTGTNGIHMMFMRFADRRRLPGASPMERATAGTGLGRSCRSTRVCAPGPGWSRSSAGRTASSSCRSARSRGAGRRSATGSRWSPPLSRSEAARGHHRAMAALRRFDRRPLSISRFPRPVRVAAARARRCARPASRRSTPVSACPAGPRSACRPTSRRRSSSSSGARRSPDPCATASTT